MAKAVDDDGSGDMGFNEFLEVIMIVNEMKKLGCSRAEVMLPGDPDGDFFMLERSGEGRHVGKEMADVTVRKLFQGLPPDRLSEVCDPGRTIATCPCRFQCTCCAWVPADLTVDMCLDRC